jgi:hypothetical protein
MSQSPIVLNYASLRPRTGLRLALEEAEGQVRVLFSVTPRWAFPLYAVGLLAPAAMNGLVAIVNFQKGEPDNAPLEGRDFFIGIILPGIMALALAGLAESALWRMAFWSREHRVLVATSNGLLLSRVGFWRLHQKWWPVQQIQAIELRRVPGSFQVIDTVRYLIIRFTNGTSRRFYFNTPDRALPNRIAERLAAVLGCPLKQKNAD